MVVDCIFLVCFGELKVGVTVMGSLRKGRKEIVERFLLLFPPLRTKGSKKVRPVRARILTIFMNLKNYDAMLFAAIHKNIAIRKIHLNGLFDGELGSITEWDVVEGNAVRFNAKPPTECTIANDYSAGKNTGTKSRLERVHAIMHSVFSIGPFRYHCFPEKVRRIFESRLIAERDIPQFTPSEACEHSPNVCTPINLPSRFRIPAPEDPSKVSMA